ncbi:MAG: DUF1302 family protein [Nitrospirota bacterium]
MSSLTKVKNILRVKLKYQLTGRIRMVGAFRYAYDHVYDIADPNKVNPRPELRELGIPRIQDPNAISPAGKELIFGVPEEAKEEIEIKELYIDALFEDVDIRIGRQLVFWGVSDFRITDDINPINFREFILRDIEDLRIPLWMGKMDYYYGDNNIELLLIPDIKFHEPALNGSEFEFFRRLPDDKVPETNINNTEWGVKIGGIKRGIEWSINILSVFDDFPSAFRLLRTDILCTNQATVSTVIFSPRHPRLTISGGSFRGILNRFVISGEAAYITGKYFGIDPGIKDCEDIANAGSRLIEFNRILGELQKDYVKGAIGTAFSVMGADIAIQLWQQYILNYDERIMEDGYQVSFSLFFRRPFYKERYIPQALVLYFVNGAQFLYRPKISYRYSDDIKFTIGMDIFAGKEGDRNRPGNLNFLGQFNNRDRVYMEIQYSF